MKKTYIQPKSLLVNLEAENILAGSELGINAQAEEGTGSRKAKEMYDSDWDEDF